MIAKVVSKNIFVPSEKNGEAVLASSYYTSLTNNHLVSTHVLLSQSDTVDVAYQRHSSDNGKTWSDPKKIDTKFEAENGVGRRHPRGGAVDINNGRYLTVWTEGVLPTDIPVEGMKHWTLRYSVSENGGESEIISKQIIHEGEEFDEIHHLPDVTVGKNCLMMGDLGQRPLFRKNGDILVPVQSSRVDSNGNLFNPNKGHTFTDCMLLKGRWKPDTSIAWTCSDRVCGNPDLTSRGLIEPTIAELPDGRILMVMRGSNQGMPNKPGYRWCAYSSDGGNTWDEPIPWTFSNGETFYSPSSCSQLIPHSSGRLFWMGNICEKFPDGNSPRYPIYLCEVDLETGRVIQDSMTVVDDKREAESPYLTLSNFYVREDRETNHLLLHMTRLFANDFRENDRIDWTANALLYRIELI